jgi:hypothetical protein
MGVATISGPLIVGLVMLIATFAFMPAKAASPEDAGAIYLTDTVESRATAPATVAQCGELPI